MRRYVLSLIAVLIVASAVTGSVVQGSASVTGSVPQSGAGATTVNVGTSTSSRSMGTQARQVQTGAAYVAMGDSVAAGAGLSAAANVSDNDELCDRSVGAYPYLIAANLQTSVVHTACSGAKVDEGIYDDQTRDGVNIPAQLPTAFATDTPDLITVTIGANDIRWNQFIRQCYATRCGFAVDNARTKLYRADLRIELTRMLHQINSRSIGNPPKVLISGYYSPIATTECLRANRITPAEVSWLNSQTTQMNQAIRSVVPLFTFAEYVPIDFTGHEVCSADPWVQGLEAAAPIHPTETGHAAIAQSFLDAIDR